MENLTLEEVEELEEKDRAAFEELKARNPLCLLREGMSLQEKLSVLEKEFMKDPSFVIEMCCIDLEFDHGDRAVSVFKKVLHDAKIRLGRKLTPAEIRAVFHRLDEELNGLN